LIIHAIFLGHASSSVAAIKERDTQVLEHLAEEFYLAYTAFSSLISPEGGSSFGNLTLAEAFESHLEPAPITPTSEDSPPWRLFSGTVKATYNAQHGLEGEDNIFVSPGVLTGNTGRCPSPVLFTRVER
jgi:Gly-Xaa carboxypeptidase